MKHDIEYAKKLFTHSLATPEQTEYNAKAWIAAVQALGDKWILANNVKRKESK